MSVMMLLSVLASLALLTMAALGLFVRPWWLGWLLFSVGGIGVALSFDAIGDPDFLLARRGDELLSLSFQLGWIALFPLLRFLLRHHRWAFDLVNLLGPSSIQTRDWSPAEIEERSFYHSLKAGGRARRKREKRIAETTDQDGLYRDTVDDSEVAATRPAARSIR